MSAGAVLFPCPWGNPLPCSSPRGRAGIDRGRTQLFVATTLEEDQQTVGQE